jgi:cytosine/adenosine deaminase-related metal-dependent hydrolase
MGSRIGSLDVGKQFDAVLAASPVEPFEEDQLHSRPSTWTDEDRFDQIIYCSDDRHVKRVYVDGVERIAS